MTRPDWQRTSTAYGEFATATEPAARHDQPNHLAESVLVPFRLNHGICPAFNGIRVRMWYRRTFAVPDTWGEAPYTITSAPSIA